MSKERELLRRLVDSGVLGGYSFIAEVKELLTQPEQEQEPNQDIISDIEYLITAFENGADADEYWRPISELKEDLNTLKGQVTSQEPVVIDENTSDGYHTFKELYESRKAYNVVLFNEWGATGKCYTHKSWRHNDGELCFGGGWFIVVAVLPQGQISNHYEAKDWDLFSIQEVEKALFEFDGHTGADVVERLKLYTSPLRRLRYE